jgi:bifunctional ADP-heptose synthase (sugar kinase/adenylyltransferase)
MGPDAIDAWYQQEYEREYAVNARKAERRRQLRAADEERKRKVDERRARMTPEAREKLKAGIAGLKEYTKEELKEEARLAQIKKKQDRALLRRWRNGNGSGDEPDAQ